MGQSNLCRKQQQCFERRFESRRNGHDKFECQKRHNGGNPQRFLHKGWRQHRYHDPGQEDRKLSRQQRTGSGSRPHNIHRPSFIGIVFRRRDQKHLDSFASCLRFRQHTSFRQRPVSQPHRLWQQCQTCQRICFQKHHIHQRKLGFEKHFGQQLQQKFERELPQLGILFGRKQEQLFIRRRIVLQQRFVKQFRHEPFKLILKHRRSPQTLAPYR